MQHLYYLSFASSLTRIKWLCLLTLVSVALISVDLLASPQEQDNAADSQQAQAVYKESLDRSYRRLLPLEGGSNFRDMGGYSSSLGGTVKRGLLFRSGAMTSLTTTDVDYLDQFDFEAVVDLRSSEEVSLFPNVWVEKSDVPYLKVDYSILTMMAASQDEDSMVDNMSDYSEMYRSIHRSIEPQLKLYFETLLDADGPVVVNCSAGQDRTGVASALVLSVLGVAEDQIIEDYLLSTDFRRPQYEFGAVDLEAAAQTNAFAAIMLRYETDEDRRRANPLVTKDGIPFIAFTLAEVRRNHGSVESYLLNRLGLSRPQIERLKGRYLSK